MDEDFQKVVERLARAGSLLMVTHARPDGDGLGSCLALARAARAAGKSARVLVPDQLPSRYEWLLDGEDVAGPEQFESLADSVDLVVVIDTTARRQLDGIDQAIVDRAAKTIVIDHHATGDEIASQQWVDPAAAAAGVMTWEAIDALGWPADLATAEALSVALTSDTGWLRFANTDMRCLLAMARFVEMGVRTDRLYARLYQADRPERLFLMVRMLERLELHSGGRLATMMILAEDFARTGARPDETENLVNEALRIGSVETAILLVQNGEQVRVSLRSRDAVDVAQVARAFGGGGHARAAGLRSEIDINELKKKLVRACAAELDKFAPG